MNAYSPLHPDRTSLPVATLAQLRSLQGAIAARFEPVARRNDVTLVDAVGRVLAAHPEGTPPLMHAPPGLPAGTRIEARHLPVLAAAGYSTVHVHGRLRVGVVALLDDASAGAMPGASAMTAAMLAGALAALGAQVFEAACRTSCNDLLVRTIRMFAGQCDLILIAGFLDPARCAAVRAGLALDGEQPEVQVVRAHPQGALQLAPLGNALVLALSADPSQAMTTFATLVMPAVRRLQGRTDVFPHARRARLARPGNGEAGPWRMHLVREAKAEDARGMTSLLACVDDAPAPALADADGLAWHALDLESGDRDVVAFLPFRTWLA